MAEQNNKTASGYRDPSDGKIHYFRDDDAQRRIAILEEKIKAMESLNVLVVKDK